MNKYLVTGRAGSGKSEVNTELQQRNQNSLDTDKKPGLASWRDLASGERVKVGAFVDSSKTGWMWDNSVLRGILQAKKKLILCGSADNDLEYFELFDKVYVLTLDPETQRQRLTERPSSYGKDLAMQDKIIAEQTQFVADSMKLGAVAIDNTRPIKTVVDEILGRIPSGE